MKFAKTARARADVCSDESKRRLCAWQTKVDKLPKDRRVWNRRHVHIYLNWCKVKFDLEELFPETQFGDVDGQTLCTMSWNEFVHRAPFTGDIVYEHLKG